MRPPRSTRSARIDVLGVDGEIVRELGAAARAERHAGQMLVLRQVAGDEVLLLPVGHRRVADREPADLAGGGDVALEQHRRDAERARDVVEAVARVVGRQERRRIDLEREQVADRVRVLGAVHAMQRRAARVRLGSRMRVELALEIREELRLARPRRDAASNAGGIMPAPSLRTTFSQVSGFSATCRTSTLSKKRPAYSAAAD